ncbi:hypothetical protein K474DRAFT_486291 [Panus rudis PR-1116 ss-1]|nr:hypothetical protein K474DRAFT_486291 [Panus rudis PR-1116 ss-1]
MRFVSLIRAVLQVSAVLSSSLCHSPRLFVQETPICIDVHVDVRIYLDCELDLGTSTHIVDNVSCDGVVHELRFCKQPARQTVVSQRSQYSRLNQSVRV